MLLKGVGPTLVGYLWYGVTVYPGYELFKRLFVGLAGPLNATLLRVPLVLAAGATATCFACIGVCPAEVRAGRGKADVASWDRGYWWSFGGKAAHFLLLSAEVRGSCLLWSLSCVA